MHNNKSISVVIVALSFVILVLGTSCSEDTYNGPSSNEVLVDLEDITVEDGFDFAMLKDVNLEVSVKNKFGNPVEGVRIYTYILPFANDGLPGEAMGSGITKDNGVYTAKFQVPTYVNTIYIQADLIGTSNQTEALIIGNSAICELGGASENSSNHKSGGVIRYSSRPAKLSTPNGSIDGADEPDFQYMGNYNQVGVPDYLENDDYDYEDDFLADINESLPEGQSVLEHHPEFLANDIQTNIVLDEDAEVWVGFIHEGAGYKNGFGYYTYEVGSPPESPDDVDPHYVVFPNASYQGAGGGLQSGNKVYLGEFPANTVLCWWVAADGWDGDEVTTGNWMLYSNVALNPENDPDQRQHNVLLLDDNREFLVLGFEDIQRPGGDKDFNDVVFSVEVNPWESVNRDGLPDIDGSPDDRDDDGVPDANDDYPDDPERAFNSYYPGEDTYGALAFEDLWPKKGDYDFNDLVVTYRFNQVSNADNDIVDIIGNFDIKAVGASFHNGLGIQLPIAPGEVESVTGSEINRNYLIMAQNGVESGQSQAVIIIFDDTFPLVQAAGGDKFVNTETGSPQLNADEITITINLTNPIDSDLLDSPPYNPFLIIKGIRGREVHLTNYPPTDLADYDYFGTEDDSSVPGNDIYYRTENNLVWALLVPGDWQHVIERYQFILGYPNSVPWMESGGEEHQDWYLDEGDNIDLNYIWEPAR